MCGAGEGAGRGGGGLRPAGLLTTAECGWAAAADGTVIYAAWQIKANINTLFTLYKQ